MLINAHLRNAQAYQACTKPSKVPLPAHPPFDARDFRTKCPWRATAVCRQRSGFQYELLVVIAKLMMHRDAPISNPPIENASLKIENLCRNSDTKELRKLTLVRFVACVLQERFLGVRPGRREVQGDLEEWGGMSTVGYNLNREDSGYIDAEWRGYKWIFIYIYLYIEW